MTDYFVNPSTGSDAAAGTSVGTAWLTLQKAADTLIGGDEVFYMNTATETPSARVDFDTNTGSEAAPIVFTAADSGGTPLTTGFTTLSGSSLPATTDLTFFSLNAQYIIFNRIRLTGGTRDGITFGTNTHYLQLHNCRVDNFASDGLFSTTTNGHVWAVNTDFDNNTSQGININAAGRLNATFLGCRIFDNGSIGAEIGGDAESVLVDYCEFYGNTGDGLQLLGQGAKATNNTVYNNAGDGVFVDDGNCFLYNNSSSSNTAFGFNISTNGDNNLVMDFNHTDNNTSGASNITMPGLNNQTGAPDFANAAGADFQPSATSPLTDNAVFGVDIGARKAASSGGGSGISTLIGEGGLIG